MAILEVPWYYFCNVLSFCMIDFLLDLILLCQSGASSCGLYIFALSMAMLWLLKVIK